MVWGKPNRTPTPTSSVPPYGRLFATPPKPSTTGTFTLQQYFATKKHYLRRITLTILVTIGIGAWLITHSLRLSRSWLPPTTPILSSSSSLTSSSSVPKDTSIVSYICSHKLANNSQQPGPLTYTNFIEQWNTLILQSGIRCVDLDVTRIQVPVVSSGKSTATVTISSTLPTEEHILLGHPGDIAQGIANGIIYTGTMVSFWKGLELFRTFSLQTLSSSPSSSSQFCFTLELKGNLRTDQAFIDKLADTLNNPSICYGIIGINGRENEDIRIPNSLQLVYQMRDIKPSPPTNTDNNNNDPTIYPCDIDPQESIEAILHRLERYTVIMPSMKCLMNSTVQSVLSFYNKKWSSTNDKNINNDGSSISTSGTVQRKEVRTWTVDTCENAKLMVQLGSTHIITNEAIMLMDKCL